MPSVSAALDGFLVAVLVAIAVIDIRTLRVPNVIVLPAIAAVLVTRVVFLPGSAPRYVAAGLLAAAVLLLPHLVRAEGIGMGDVKLALLLGTVLGTAAIDALLVAFIACLPFSLVVYLRRRQTPLPFAPFMAVGALVVLIFAPVSALGG